MLKTVEEIENWLDVHGVDNYTIFKNDLTVDVLGSVDLSFGLLKSIPVQFGKVGGDFDCSYNQLTSLAGAPKEVGGSFICGSNYIFSLEGGPSVVGGGYNCSHNQISTLKFAPISVGRHFALESNKLEALDNMPKHIGGSARFWNNPLKTLGFVDSTIGEVFLSPPIKELSTIAEVDNDGDFRIKAEDFNAKIQELKRIREERALLESSVAKLCDSAHIGSSPEAKPPESTAQQTVAQKRKFKI